MRNLAFRALLDLLMVSDPFPLDEISHDELCLFADQQSLLRGFENWIVAYHEYKRLPLVKEAADE